MSMEQNRKPFDEWTLKECYQYCCDFRRECDSMYLAPACEENGCVLYDNNICNNWAYEWANTFGTLHLTEAELSICKTVGAKWVSLDGEIKGHVPRYVCFHSEKPFKTKSGMFSDCYLIGTLHRELFPSMRPGDCFYVEGEKDA